MAWSARQSYGTVRGAKRAMWVSEGPDPVRATGDSGSRAWPRTHGRALAVADALLAAGVVAPAVVGYWRGTWCLMDLSVGWAPSLAAGLAGHLLFTLGQGHLAAAAALPGTTPAATPAASGSRCRRATALLASRIYTAIFGFCCVNAWRGTWKLLDQYSGAEPRALFATGGFGVAALLVTRTLRNITAPPFVIATDIGATYFDVPTMFRVTSTRHAYLYVLDCVFSVLFVGTLVVFVWRGAWTLLDLYLYPGLPESAWASLCLGYMITTVTFAIQPLMEKLCEYLTGVCRLLVADFYLFFSFCGTVNVWRGFWNILHEYLFPDHEVISCLVSHIAGFLLLMVLNCSNSILVRGVYIDAEEEGGKCADLPTKYLRLFVSTRPQRQHNHHDSQQMERMLATTNISPTAGTETTNDTQPSHTDDGDLSVVPEKLALNHDQETSVPASRIHSSSPFTTQPYT